MVSDGIGFDSIGIFAHPSDRHDHRDENPTMKKIISSINDKLNQMLFGVVLLADNTIGDIFGTVSPDVPKGLNPDTYGGVGKTLGHFIGVLIRVFVIVASIALLVMLLWGAFDYITSGGEEKNVANAQKKMSSAVMGILLLIFMFVLWEVIVVRILGIVGPGMSITLPQL